MGNNAYLDEANELLGTLRQEDIVSFVSSVLADNPVMLHRFLRRFGPFDLERAKSDLLMDLRQAESDNSAYGDGYVDWRHSDTFASDVRQLVAAHVDDVLARDDHKSALALGFEAYLFLTQVDVDDSGGFSEDMLDVLDDSWDTLYETARKKGDDGLLQLLFEELEGYTTDPAIRKRAYSDALGYDLHDYQCDHIQGYLVEHFSVIPAYAPAIQEIADRELASAVASLEARKAEDERLGRPFYGRDFYMRTVVHWVLVRLRCMEATGAPYASRLEFARSYLGEEAVCLHFVDEREQADDHAEALRLLEACLDDAWERDVAAPDWALARAIGLYEHEGNVAAVRELLEQLVVVGAHRTDAGEWLRKLRSLCDCVEWAQLRETILNRVQDDRSRWRYYVEEQMLDRLMDEVERKGADALGEFEEHLAPRYPKRVLALYEADLMGYDGNRPPVGSTRKSYAHYASRVRHIRSIAGGSELADRIVAHVLDLYPRRPALRDELATA